MQDEQKIGRGVLRRVHRQAFVHFPGDSPKFLAYEFINIPLLRYPLNPAQPSAIPMRLGIESCVLVGR